MNLIWIFLPIILALGTITSYEDIKTGKIRNKWIITALLISIIINFTLYTLQIIDLSYVGKTSIFVTFSFITGFALYLIGMWSAGDAKLYTAYVALIPLTTYNIVTTSFWPLEIMINTILPVFIFLIFNTIRKLNSQQLLQIIKNMLNPKQIGIYLLTIFSISWIIQITLTYFNIQTNFLLNITLITLTSQVLRKIYPYELNYLLLLITILRAFINKNQMTQLNFWQNFLLMTITYMLILFFINELAKTYTKKTNINYLREGMQPAQYLIKYQNQYHRTDTINEEQELIYKQKPEGLTKEDIEQIQKLHRTGHLHFNTIRTQQTIPFAPYMFAGTLITTLIQGNIILWIKLII